MSNGINAVGHNYNYQQMTQTQPPKESGWSKFGKVIGGVASALPMVGGVMGALGVGSGGSVAGAMDGSFNKQYELIMLQQHMQQQTQMFQTMSNISKSKHEAAMTAVRNIK